MITTGIRKIAIKLLIYRTFLFHHMFSYSLYFLTFIILSRNGPRLIAHYNINGFPFIPTTWFNTIWIRKKNKLLEQPLPFFDIKILEELIPDEAVFAFSGKMPESNSFQLGFWKSKHKCSNIYILTIEWTVEKKFLHKTQMRLLKCLQQDKRLKAINTHRYL